ncbi:MAG TPA: VOC family protein [Patescibacteria group bacterium]|nr:VOC family protein [Patescibacteria group bacterium]
MYDIAHIGMVISDTERSREFYQQVLGCETVESYQDERVRLTFLRAGGQIIELIQYMQAPAAERLAGVVDHIAFRVPDMDTAWQRLKEQQVTILFEEPRIVGNKKILFFSGPDKERLEFVQEMR